MNRIIEQDVKSILAENLPWNELKNSVIMVTGANGFIPSYIVETLLAIGDIKVIALVRNLKKAQEKFKHHRDNPNLEIFVHDLTQPIHFDGHVDYIIHAASQASPKFYGVDPVGTLRANTIGTASLLELAKEQKVKKFLFVSSSEVYGNTDQELIPENCFGNVNITDIRSCYAESKRMGENMCVCYSSQYDIPVNQIRLAHIYGSGISLDDGRVFADFVKNIINNENIVLNSDGSAKRCFMYITDMIRAMFYIFFNGENRESYNISSGKETSILELANLLIGLYPEKDLKVSFSDNVLSKGYIPSKTKRVMLDTQKLKSLGWDEKIDIKTGFKRMVDSYVINSEISQKAV